MINYHSLRLVYQLSTHICNVDVKWPSNQNVHKTLGGHETSLFSDFAGGLSCHKLSTLKTSSTAACMHIGIAI